MSAENQLNIKKFVFNPLQENCYLLWDGEKKAVIVDPGCFWQEEFPRLKEYVSSEGLVPKEIWLTHAHFDHVFGLKQAADEYGIPVRMGAGESLTIKMNAKHCADFGLPEPDFSSLKMIDAEDGQTINTLKGLEFKVIGTPGHTQGGVCYYCETAKVLLSGDTLFAGCIGRTDFEGGDYDKLITGIMEKLMGLPGDTDVLSGHGSATTIGTERTTNPFLQPFNEPGQNYDF